MGLDMYLIGEKYIKDRGHNYKEGIIPDDTPAKICQKAAGVKFPVTLVEVELGYWRKANAIHKWFVNNVQGGRDECQKAYVSMENLLELRNLCAEVLEKPNLAGDLLPTGSGFFFGNTDYGEWYLQDLRYTVELIDKLLSAEETRQLSIYYQASW